MRPLLAVSMALVWMSAAPAFAAGRCTGFKWDVSQELALFDGTAAALTAGKGAPSAPRVDVGRLYLLQLSPQSEVAFAMTPGRSTATEGAFAGLVKVHVQGPGHYRFAVDAPVWLDIVSNGSLAAPTDFQGQHDCDGPRKIVEFDLTGARDIVLQVSGSAKPALKLAITRSPARTT